MSEYQPLILKFVNEKKKSKMTEVWVEVNEVNHYTNVKTAYLCLSKSRDAISA